MNKSIIHAFSVDMAMVMGLEEAIVYNQFLFWINHNEANNRNFHNGKYWTYNSFKALQLLFPYWSERTIKRIIANLIKHKLLIKDCNSKNWSDRTNWYSVNVSDCPNASCQVYTMTEGQSDTMSEGQVDPMYINTTTQTNTYNDTTALETKTPNKVLKTKSAVAAKEPKESSREAHVSSPHQEVIAYFVDAYLKHKGIKYHFLPKDAALISTLLKTADKSDIIQRIDALFYSKDPWILSSGHTVGVLFGCFNRLTIQSPKVIGAAGREL